MAVLYFTGEGSLPSGKIPDGIFLQAGLAVFALRERYPFTRANKNIAPPFKSLTRIKQFMRSPVKIKNRLNGGFIFYRGRFLAFR